MGEARITAIIPCYEDGDFVHEAVASIDEPEPIQIIVIDDGSRDPGTVERLAELESKPGVRVIRHERNRGLAAARNTGLAAAETPYVYNLDADDRAVPGSLPVMADRLDEHPEASACIGDFVRFGDADGVGSVTPRLDPFRVAYNNEWPVTALWRRSALEAVGGWRASEVAMGYEDWDLWMTFAERGFQIVYAGEGVPGYYYRVHSGRMSSTTGDMHEPMYEELRRRHARLFAELPEHRRRSDLPLLRKWLYPVVYRGGRKRFTALRNLLRPVLGRHRLNRRYETG